MTSTRLRAARPDEAELLAAWRADPTSPYDELGGPQPAGWEGAPPPPRPEGIGELVVTGDDDVPIGSVSWRPMAYGPNAGSQSYEIGISLRPAARGRGHGSRAQRLLADHLFATTAVHRVSATTDVDNVVEQRALARAGFVFEGVLREAQWRAGAHHSMQSWSRLRTDA